jgi:hypothetical protein
LTEATVPMVETMGSRLSCPLGTKNHFVSFLCFCKNSTEGNKGKEDIANVLRPNGTIQDEPTISIVDFLPPPDLLRVPTGRIDLTEATVPMVETMGSRLSCPLGTKNHFVPFLCFCEKLLNRLLNLTLFFPRSWFFLFGD